MSAAEYQDDVPKYQCSVREPIPRKDVMCCNVQRLTKPFGDVST